jgi:predicted DNA-binding protein (MmcQ/YjbR family)
MAAPESAADAALDELRAFGLTYPGAHTKSPWPGHLDLAVNDKTFAYLSVAGDPFKVSCKLPRTHDDALQLPFVTPTEYGLGKSGWVTARLPDGPVPIELFKAWIDESYRAQAPKRLVAQLPSDGQPAAAERAQPVAKARSRPAQRAAKQAASPRSTKKKAAAKPARTGKAPATARKRAKKRPARAARSR